MKKLIVKSEIVVIPYSPAVEAIEAVEYQPEKWIKEDQILFEAPEDLTGWTYHPAVEAVEGVEGKPEQLEVKEWRVIAQTQGTEEELAVWLAGDAHKYPEGYQVEYIDITAEVIQEKVNEDALKYLAETDWLIIRQIDAGIPCPEEIKIKRQEARSKIIK